MKNILKSIGFVLMIILSIVLTVGCDNSLPESNPQTEDIESTLAIANTDDNYNSEAENVSSSEYPKAQLGEKCVSPALLTVMEGVCQEPSQPCPGGYPDAFNLKGLLPPIPFLPAPGVGHMPGPPDPAGTCESDLKCCVDSDWGEKLATEVGTYPILRDIVENIECSDTGICKGSRKRELLELGCPEGQSCCIEVKTLWEIISAILD